MLRRLGAQSPKCPSAQSLLLHSSLIISWRSSLIDCLTFLRETSCQLFWMDGKLVEEAKATVPFLTTALHYGLGVFEGIRCYDTEQGPAIFRLKEHMERLVNSAKVLGFRSLPYTAEEMGQACKDVVKANGFTDCYIRPLIYHYQPDASA